MYFKTLISEILVWNTIRCKAKYGGFSWANVEIFTGIPFRLLTMQWKWTFTNALFSVYTTKKLPYFTATVTKTALRWPHCSLSLMLLFTQYKTMWFAAISSHCLAACSQTQEVGNRQFPLLSLLKDTTLIVFFIRFRYIANSSIHLNVKSEQRHVKRLCIGKW